MSYDLAVFDPLPALRDRRVFEAWFAAWSVWDEDYDYNDLSRATPALQTWFLEIIQTFPPLNGPFAVQSDDEEMEAMVADYFISPDTIFVTFGWPVAGLAYETCARLAEKHRVGFFEASGNAAWFPGPHGELELVHA